jgi:hypothetical protein
VTGTDVPSYNIVQLEILNPDIHRDHPAHAKRGVPVD